MQDDKPFFLRDPWRFDPHTTRAYRKDIPQGFDTRALHTVTFGTSRTICMHPATITHGHMTPDELSAAGIDDGLVRLSVGLEDP